MMSATLDAAESPAPTTLPLFRRLAVMLGTAMLLTFLAPFGTQATPLPRRLLDWCLMALVWEAAVFATWHGMQVWRKRRGVVVPERLSLRMMVVVVAVASVPAVPLSLIALYGRMPSLAVCANFYLDALVLGFVISLARSRLLHGRVAASPPAPAVTEVAPVVSLDRAFLLRHAPQLDGAQLLALEAEDHYLRIHTDRGHALVLLRLRDAVESLGEGRGVQVHRSFWVACDAGPTASRRGQAWQLDLPGGLAVPVSRANIGACREIGWLSGS